MTLPDAVRRVLLDAADLIEPEGCWTQGNMAVDADGHLCMPRGRDAVCWCALGAIARSSPSHGVSMDAVGLLRLHLKGSRISEWNDAPGRTQAEVVSALRAAAGKGKEEA